jgi:hypothetical protein
MKINHSFQINSLLKMIPPPPVLGELFCGGKNYNVKNNHKSLSETEIEERQTLQWPKEN